MVYRHDFLAELERQRAIGRARHSAVLDEKRTLSAVVSDECPEYGQFLHRVELCGDVQAAARLLPQVIDAGCVAQHGEYLSTDKLRSGVTVWKLRTRAFGIVGLHGAGENARLGESWNEVSLRMKVEVDKNRIDTEFFGWNEEVDEEHNPTNDVEKIHIVWQLDRAADRLDLVYAGFGANQPYAQAHPHSGRFEHRPRYRVFDRDSNEEYAYDVQWQRLGEFDWNWTYSAPVLSADSVTLKYVRIFDDIYLCLSDKEVAGAAAGDEYWVTWREMLRAANALSEVQAWEASVKVPTVQPIGSPPELADIVGEHGRNYSAYFTSLYATRLTIGSTGDVRKVTRALGPDRGAEYDRILSRPCNEVFEPKYAQQLPSTMGDLFAATKTDWDPVLRAGTEQWCAQLVSELERDLYYYGQDALSRMNRLRFAAWLALQPAHGSIYWTARDLALKALKGESTHGNMSETFAASRE